MNREDLKSALAARVRNDRDTLVDLSHRIHEDPELAFQEDNAARNVAKSVKDAASTVEVGVYDLSTAIEARIGDGEFAVAVLAEYDALPGIGHGCGHNIIAAAAAGAFRALAPFVTELGIQLRLLGTPAEEGGGGKILMLDRGAFHDVAAALMVHPGPIDLPYMPSLATTRLDITFTGKSAHASAFPELGINAADAAVISQVAIGLLRQRMTGDQRVHGITVHGGDAPNVIPDETRLDYLVRASDLESLETLESQLRQCFEAGAVGTGAEVEIERSMPTYAALLPDPLLTNAYQTNAESLGRPVRPVSDRAKKAAGSTDMGNVSQQIPSIHPMIGLGRDAGVIHSHDFSVAARSEVGDEAVVDGAITLASTIVDAALDEQIRSQLGNPRDTP
jgi:amidohydrolase